MKTVSRLLILVIATLLASVMFFGNKYVSEAQSARFYLNWTVDCGKGETVKILPRYDRAFDWTDKYSGVVEKIVPLELSCKTGANSERKVCNGYITTRASRLDPMNISHATCYAVP